MSRTGLQRRQVMQGIGIGAAGLLAGCLGGEDDDDEIHILTDYTGEGGWDPYWEDELIPGFEEEHDIPVNVEPVGFQGTGEQRLATLMQSGNPPELFHGTITEIGDLVNQGRTQSIDDVTDDLEDIWGDTLFKNTLQPVDGETHMVPHGVYMGGCLNYREDIYQTLDLEVPETWSELVENARIIDEAEIELPDGETMRGFGLPAQLTGKSASDFSNWLFNAGGDTWRWSEDDELELWMDEDHVMAVFEHLQELVQYSPDPSSLDWGTTIEYWVGSRFGQCLMNNAWLCGPAYNAGQEDTALNTKQALVPKLEGSDPLQRGWVLADGTPIIEGSSNPDEAGDFLRYMYSEERHPTTTLIEPMRFLPPYEAVTETEAYQSAEIFQVEDGAFLERNQYILDEIAPELENPDSPTTPETLHVNTFDIPGEMTNRVIVDEEDPQSVYEWGIDEYEKRLAEVSDQSNY